MSLQHPFKPVFKPSEGASLSLLVSYLSATPPFGFSLNSGLSLVLFWSIKWFGASHAPAGCMSHPRMPRGRGGVCAPFPLAAWCPETPCVSPRQRDSGVYHAAGELGGNTAHK